MRSFNMDILISSFKKSNKLYVFFFKSFSLFVEVALINDKMYYFFNFTDAVLQGNIN